MMNHLADDQLYTIAFDEQMPNEVSVAHLAECAHCQAQLAELKALAAALAVAKQSEPSPVALARYNMLFAEIQPAPSRLSEIVETIRAAVTWNGREQAQAQGIRNVGLAGYRMLYATPQAEIELLIEPQNGSFTVEGELLPIQEALIGRPLWIEVQQLDGSPMHSLESDDQGRFRLPGLPAGQYTLYLLPPTGAALLLEGLALA